MYKFYLDGMLLPVTPEKLSTKIGTNNKTISLANSGEINLITFPKLTNYNFEFELPHDIKNVSYRVSNYEPKKILDKLEEAVGTKKVIPFVVLRQMGNKRRFDLEAKVTIENYDAEESADNNSDFVVKIELKQFKNYRTKHLINPDDQKPKPPKPTTPKVPGGTSVYKVRRLKILAYYLYIRKGPGKSYPHFAKFKKGQEPCAYAEQKVGSTTWYKIKHSAGPDGWGWISGNPKYTKVIR